ncbi:MAG: dihydroorotase [Elusimicrobiaceae bacterium]|nr:dihydroorotase [Elusimicrobiaceae bacterium]MBT3955464.1 dihydroorotase [Elusimicrobiaceae bacterium]MBT4008216.1 dihydroorotase [Elusimicrobiaceae bacterium]MBT4403082.1 dihydroorotase [Elusimicrobiaceae bacterium]MBT4439340.1 dihydroorotase [Elusimicrobiaceae bacterium]
MKYLIKNSTVIDPKNNINEVLDVLISNGKIKQIGKNLKALGAKTINAKGMITAPGFVDMHVHFRQPGFEYKETILSGSLSAIKGGVTSVAVMPNTNPVMDTSERVENLQKIIKKDGKINVFVLGCITREQKGENITDFSKLKSVGCVGFTDDGHCVNSAKVMEKAFEKSGKRNLLFISHAEDTSLSAGGVMNEGFIADKLGLKGVSNESEYKIVERDIKLAKKHKARIHIAHVSTKESCELIRKAKKQGVKITAEATPHHFTLTEKECESFNANFKMAPPLRKQKDVDAIKKAIKDGTINCIATDHAPHAVHEKDIEFSNAMNGIIGLETALPLAIENLVDTKHLNMMGLVCVMSYSPAQILGVDKGHLTEGSEADVVVFDPQEKWIYNKEDIVSKSKNSPFIGKELKGKVKYTFVAGKLAS